MMNLYFYLILGCILSFHTPSLGEVTPTSEENLDGPWILPRLAEWGVDREDIDTIYRLDNFEELTNFSREMPMYTLNVRLRGGDNWLYFRIDRKMKALYFERSSLFLENDQYQYVDSRGKAVADSAAFTDEVLVSPQEPSILRFLLRKRDEKEVSHSGNVSQISRWDNLGELRLAPGEAFILAWIQRPPSKPVELKTIIRTNGSYQLRTYDMPGSVSKSPSRVLALHLVSSEELQTPANFKKALIKIISEPLPTRNFSLSQIMSRFDKTEFKNQAMRSVMEDVVGRLIDYIEVLWMTRAGFDFRGHRLIDEVRLLEGLKQGLQDDEAKLQVTKILDQIDMDPNLLTQLEEDFLSVMILLADKDFSRNPSEYSDQPGFKKSLDIAVDKIRKSRSIKFLNFIESYLIPFVYVIKRNDRAVYDLKSFEIRDPRRLVKQLVAELSKKPELLDISVGLVFCKEVAEPFSKLMNRLRSQGK